MKRVLVITTDFPPQGGTGTIRVTKFVKYLPRFGWHPTVVCSDATWNRDESLAHDVPADVRVHRVPWPWLIRSLRPRPAPTATPSSTTAPANSRTSRVKERAMRLARRVLVPDVNVLWVPAAIRAGMTIARKQHIDTILTTSPPQSIHLVGYWLRWRTGLPWIADFRDVWTAENPALRRQGRLHFAIQRQIERLVLARCDRAVMNTEPLRRRAIATFGPHVAAKMVTVTNGYDPDDFTTQPPARTDRRFTIAFVGTVLGPQVENAFPDGLRLALVQNEEFRAAALIRFVGRLDPAYQMRLTGLQDNVEILDFVPHEQAISAMRQADALLMILPNTDLARMTFTNKFFEYLAARRPLLALVPRGLIGEIVEDEKIGIVAPPDDAQAIAHALLTMFDTVRARQDGYNASEALLARFDRRALTRELATILDQVSVT